MVSLLSDLTALSLAPEVNTSPEESNRRPSRLREGTLFDDVTAIISARSVDTFMFPITRCSKSSARIPLTPSQDIRPPLLDIPVQSDTQHTGLKRGQWVAFEFPPRNTYGLRAERSRGIQSTCCNVRGHALRVPNADLGRSVLPSAHSMQPIQPIHQETIHNAKH
jgi:hypothetical protein